MVECFWRPKKESAAGKLLRRIRRLDLHTHRALTSRQPGQPPLREPAAPFERSEFSCADVRHDVGTVKGVYDKLIEAKRSCGEATRDLSFSKFHRLVMERTEAMKEKIGSERVVFSVDVENGHVSFRAKADK